ncbi:MAG: hypothetical protein ACK5JE_12025 [Castellaniella sp.]|uniref:hypothetical protein n=1 Tax=Castellaniella sp. TaxID=1955812 RepID=UPI003A8C868F
MTVLRLQASVHWRTGWLAVVLALAGCVSASDPGLPGEPMSADQFAQSDINRLQTLAMRDNLDSLDRLLEKLYRRNPGQWRKAGFMDLKAALEQGRARIRQGAVPKELEGLQDIEVLSVAMDPRYPGDRVAAFVLGLSSTIIAAHGGVIRFHVGDSVKARHVFNAARNVEIAAWMLASRRDAQGQPLLLSNELGDGVANLSFEREFGRIIARLDLEAVLLDESLRRIGINYVQGLLFFNFLPVR